MKKELLRSAKFRHFEAAINTDLFYANYWLQARN